MKLHELHSMMEEAIEVDAQNCCEQFLRADDHYDYFQRRVNTSNTYVTGPLQQERLGAL